MMKIYFLIVLTNIFCLNFLFADHHQKQSTRPATKEDFNRFAKQEQGMWRAEVLSVIGDNSLGNKQGKTTYYWHTIFQNEVCMTSRGSGGNNTITGITFYNPVEKSIITTGVSSDGTITRSTHVPKGENWYRETVITRPDGSIVRLNSDVIHNDEKGITTIIIRGDGGKNSVIEQKNIWYRQHK